MAFDDHFRLSSHAVIINDNQEILLVKANYGDSSWGLPGGALDAGETIHEALARECREELGCSVDILYLSGVYYHGAYNSQAFIFRCILPGDRIIQLSHEHSGFKYAAIETMSRVQQRRVQDCIDYDGVVVSARF